MKAYLSDSNQHKIIRKLIAYSLISIFMTLGVFIIVVKYFPAFSIYVSGTIDWSILDGFAGVLSLSLLVGGFTFALAGFIDAENSKHLAKRAEVRQIFQEIMEKFDTPEHVAARRWILLNVPMREADEDISDWYKRAHAVIMKRKSGEKDTHPEGAKAVKLTLNSLNYIGWYLGYPHSIVGKNDPLLELISQPIALVWGKIEPYVLYERAQRGEADYYAAAEFIGSISSNWQATQDLNES